MYTHKGGCVSQGVEVSDGLVRGDDIMDTLLEVPTHKHTIQ